MLNDQKTPAGQSNIQYSNELEAQVAANKYQILNEIAMNNNQPNAVNMNMTMNQFGQSGVNFPMPMPKSNNLQFMPNMNNNDLQNQAILQRNINTLGGINPVIPTMHQTLVDNELRHIDQNRGHQMSPSFNMQNPNMGGLNANTMQNPNMGGLNAMRNTNMGGFNPNNMQNPNMGGLNANTMDYQSMQKPTNYMPERFDPMNLKTNP